MSNDKRATISIGDGIGGFAIIVLIIMCLGTPDILDGIIKRVNTVECGK